MNIAAIASITYGLIALIGGIFGYTKSQSQASLISGGISGLLLLGAGGLQLNGLEWGKWLGLAIASALVVVFIVRWVKTQKPMPALPMILAGVLSAIAMVIPA
jgi:uncharacterized membrane protein (UPF0136 family)